jgi:predicted phage terminase large subunit-like protein
MRRKQRDDEASFEGQINQNPHPRTTVSFERTLLVKRTISFNLIPTVGPVIITWDFGFSKKRGRDYTAGAASIYNNKGQLFVIDLIRQRFTPTELTKAVVDFADRYHPTVLAIEKAGGSELLDPSIKAEAEGRNKPWLLSICKAIDWFTPTQTKDAKRARMAAMHPWLVAERLWFVSHLPYLDTLYYEFERCLTAHHHDDIPDVISQQLRYVPQIQIMIDKKEFPIWNREDAAWNLIYGDWEGGQPDPFGRPGFHGSLPETAFQEPPDQGLKAVPSSDELPSMLGGGLIG